MANTEVTYRFPFRDWTDFSKYPPANDGSDIIRVQEVLGVGATGDDFLQAILITFKFMGSENGRGLDIEISPKLGEIFDVYAKDHGYHWDGEGEARHNQIHKAPLVINEDLGEFDELKWRVTRESLLEISRVMESVKREAPDA